MWWKKRVRQTHVGCEWDVVEERVRQTHVGWEWDVVKERVRQTRVGCGGMWWKKE